ncbi:MAG: glycogen synthase GlgA [Candidatus Omnitrophica bacterium]|nr:glycogen synthase GlgA [Candidatus Omnitrophota bacterium]
MNFLNIAIVSSEIVPFAKTGGLADVIGSLPAELSGLKCNVKVFMPYYRAAKKENFGISLAKNNLNVCMQGKDFGFSLYQCKSKGVDFYFIKKDEYFDREFLYGTPQGDYPDNAQRFGFFANAVLESLTFLKFKADVINCNDWQSALIPFYVRFKLKDSALFKKTKTLFTVHNLAYQGLFPREIMPTLDIGYEFFTPEALEFYGKFSFMKAGIIYSDAVSTVSSGYAKEILTKEFGCGLEGLLYTKKDSLFGILNGVDYSQWSPGADKFIVSNYDVKALKNKAECKKDLLVQMGLPVSPERCLLGQVGRLAHQKGMDLIVDSIEDIIKLSCNLVVLGAGDEQYHRVLTALSKKYPKNISVKIGFDNALAHKIEAGSDMFLMPSRYEPCGLNQMYSLKYGTIPLVRATGGLDDTITDYTRDPARGNGFKFKEATKEGFLGALKSAVCVYSDKNHWKKLMARAMGFDFSWKRSAQEYIKLYTALIKK